MLQMYFSECQLCVGQLCNKYTLLHYEGEFHDSWYKYEYVH